MKNKYLKLSLSILLVVAVAAGAWYGLILRPAGEANRELSGLVSELAPLLQSENFELSPALGEWLRQVKPQGNAAQELVAGLKSFLANDFKTADQNLAAFLKVRPDAADIISLRALANLKQGNAALADELFASAYKIKQQQSAPEITMTIDQLGQAVSLFMLGRPAEARTLAESAWQVRSRVWGEAAPDTLGAATRLATIYVALGEIEPAKTLLLDVYQKAQASGPEAASALDEAKLLLSMLYQQEGRADELAELLARPPFQAGMVEEALQDLKPEAPTEAELKEWEQLADGLVGHNDGLAAELRIRAILGRVALEGVELDHPGLRPVKLALAKAWLELGRFQLAEALLLEIAPEINNHQTDEYIELAGLFAHSLEGQGRFKDAENWWLEAASLSDDRLVSALQKGEPSPPANVEKSLLAHLGLAENYLGQGRVPPEAEMELLAALNLLDKVGAGDLKNYEPTGLVYLRLAAIVEKMNRQTEKERYCRLAQEAASHLLLAETEGQPKARLEAIIDRAKICSVAQETPKTPKEEDWSDPDVLRLELAALVALGRVDDFLPLLEPVLAKAKSQFGPTSRSYMRYFTLKLKWLEESGRFDELTQALKDQAASPPGRTDEERALNRVGALIYAAKINEKAQRPAQAVSLYTEAFVSLEGRTEPTLASRRQMIEEALARLRQ